MRRLLILCAATLAVAGCHRNGAPTPANDAAADITAYNAGNLDDDANITDVPADDGDAPEDTGINAR